MTQKSVSPQAGAQTPAPQPLRPLPGQPKGQSQTPPTGPEDGAHPHGQPPLPHERDQSAHMTNGVPSRKVQQAAKDVARGLQDTSKAVEMDRTYQQQKKK